MVKFEFSFLFICPFNIMFVIHSEADAEAAEKMYMFVESLLLDRLQTNGLVSSFICEDGKPLFDFICSLRAMHRMLSLFETAVYKLVIGKSVKQLVSNCLLHDIIMIP